jgi:hypothetical protein
MNGLNAMEAAHPPDASKPPVTGMVHTHQKRLGGLGRMHQIGNFTPSRMKTWHVVAH